MLQRLMVRYSNYYVKHRNHAANVLLHVKSYLVILQVVSLCLLVLVSEHVRAMTCTRR